MNREEIKKIVEEVINDNMRAVKDPSEATDATFFSTASDWKHGPEVEYIDTPDPEAEVEQIPSDMKDLIDVVSNIEKTNDKLYTVKNYTTR